MKVTQYVTSPSVSFRKFDRRPIPNLMEGATTVEIGTTPLMKGFMGFGVALTASSCYELNTMSAETRKAFLEDIYTEKGLNLSVARLTVSSSDYSPELYSYDDTDGDLKLEHFSIDRDREYVIPMIREALAIKPDLFLYSSPWTPPAWMKTGNSLCGGFMRAGFVDCYADYFIRYIEEYEKEGIRVRAVTPQNESETHQNGRMPACKWHPDIEAEFILSLKKKLKAKGRDTGIWMLDHNFNNYQRVLWMLETYPELSQACDGVAWHYYGGSFEMTDLVKQAFPTMTFHFTEGGPRLYDNYATDHAKWASIMIEALRHNCLSFCGWNLLLDETGGPNIGPFFCGGLATLNSETGELTYSGQYHAFRHLSRFILPGAEIYDCKPKGEGDCYSSYPKRKMPLHAIVAKNTDGTRILIAVNGDKEKQQIQCTVDGQAYYFELLPDSISTVVFESFSARIT